MAGFCPAPRQGPEVLRLSHLVHRFTINPINCFFFSSLTFLLSEVFHACILMFTNPSRRTPPTHFLYRIPPLNAARFWLARKGRQPDVFLFPSGQTVCAAGRFAAAHAKDGRLSARSVRSLCRRRAASRLLLRLFHALCHGYDLSPICLCAFPDGRGPRSRQHALHAGTPAGDPALPPRRSRDGAACSDGRFRRARRRTAQKDRGRASRCAFARLP